MAKLAINFTLSPPHFVSVFPLVSSFPSPLQLSLSSSLSFSSLADPPFLGLTMQGPLNIHVVTMMLVAQNRIEIDTGNGHQGEMQKQGEGLTLLRPDTTCPYLRTFAALAIILPFVNKCKTTLKVWKVRLLSLLQGVRESPSRTLQHIATAVPVRWYHIFRPQ